MPFRYFFDHGARWGAQGRTGAYRGALGRSLAVAPLLSMLNKIGENSNFLIVRALKIQV